MIDSQIPTPKTGAQFEIVFGKALNGEGKATRFACVRNCGFEALRASELALRTCGVTETYRSA